MRKVLSANNDAIINIECLLEDNDLYATLNRNEFEEMCMPLA